MATKKPTVKKTAKAAKKPITKKVAAKPAAKKIPAKKITVKPPVKAKPVKKSQKKGLAKTAMTKMVVDRMTLPKGGKIFVKAAKRPAAKKTAKKTK